MRLQSAELVDFAGRVVRGGVDAGHMDLDSLAFHPQALPGDFPGSMDAQKVGYAIL